MNAIKSKMAKKTDKDAKKGTGTAQEDDREGKKAATDNRKKVKAGNQKARELGKAEK